MGSISEYHQNGISTPTPATTISTDFLIIGAGPAGASLACFLAQHNLHGIMISSAPGPARTPRAHVCNSAAMECVRDLDHTLYDECVRLGNSKERLSHMRWTETLLGKEYGRIYSWGTGRKTEYEKVSPCVYMDLPQALLEPLLLSRASGRGWVVRFDTRLVSFVEEEDMVGAKNGGRNITAKVLDQTSGLEYNIQTKYLFGADGGRSVVATQLDLPFTVVPGGGLAWNVWVRADLNGRMEHCQGNLHFAMRFEKDYPFVTVMRMVKPYNEWMIIHFPKGPDAPAPERSKEEWKEIALDLFGDPTLDVEILDVSPWMIHETSADVISKGNVFCLGDAIHRHPPVLGLGSNTCIQDAFNLAWKLSLVHKGLAGHSLLSTYNKERQPVGEALVHESNDALRLMINHWLTMGMQPYGASAEDRLKAQQDLVANTKEAREKRKAMNAAQRSINRESNALGTAYGQRYESAAVYLADEEKPFQPSARETENKYLFYDPCTYPGRRLPHIWLGSGSGIPGPMTSTLDVAGNGQFSLFTGIGGDGWLDAARAVEEKLGVKVNVVRIGLGLEWADKYLSWDEVRGVEEDGCVLVRPDFFVAWRAQESGDEVERLIKVMSSILCRT